MSADRPSFGFGAKLAAIEPTGTTLPAIRREEETREVDQVADRLGFASREPAVRRKKRQGLGEAMDQVNIRAAISDINAFVEFCERNRYTLGEGLRVLVQRIDA